MNPPELERFCGEMRALAKRIDVPEDFMPFCGREGRSGMSIDMSDDGKEYVLSASERGVPYDLMRSADAGEAMEALFVDLTSRLAAVTVVNRMPPASFWRDLLGPFGRPIAVKQQREIQIVQEELLGRINPEWRDRAAIQNALRLRREVDFFFGLQ